MKNNAFEETIKAFLDGRAAADPAFAAKYAAEGKSVAKCCGFIISEVRRSGRSGFADEEIYGLAAHYYDEDCAGDSEPAGGCRVVVNREIQLTEEEKARIESEARRKAEDEYRREAETRARGESARKREKETERMEERERRRREAEDSGTLFLFND